jgi:hypothetical protein
MSWNKVPIWGLRPDPYYSETVAGLFVWCALSDERTGPSFTFVAEPRQSGHFRVRVQWDSWPYFIISDSRLPFPSPPTTHRATVEVFDPASTRSSQSQSESDSHSDWRSVSLSVLVSSPFWGSWQDINYRLTVTDLSLGGRPLWREDGSVVCQSVSSIRSIVSMYTIYILHE